MNEIMSESVSKKFSQVANELNRQGRSKMINELVSKCEYNLNKINKVYFNLVFGGMGAKYTM